MGDGQHGTWGIGLKQHVGAGTIVRHLFVLILSSCHPVILSSCRPVIMSSCHPVIMSSCHPVAWKVLNDLLDGVGHEQGLYMSQAGGDRRGARAGDVHRWGQAWGTSRA